MDWDTFDWRIGRVDDHDGFWSVELEVEGGLDAVPRFFFEHGLAYPLCVDHRGTGIGVWVETPLLGSATIDGGPMTERMERGECAGPIAAEESVPPDPVTWGAAPTWTGNALEVWNRTTLDLFLLDEAGVRVDLPACGRASTSRLDLTNTVEVRAEDGYVFAFGAGAQEQSTTFIVVLPDEPGMNGAPPVKLPPCQGVPQVQEGV